MARKPTKTNGNAGSATATPRPARLVIEVADGTPTYYSNYFEVGHTKWDFSLIATRIPAKPSSPKVVEMQTTGFFSVPADITISFPAHLMPGLIRALTIQKEAFEKLTKIELTETTDESDVQAKRGKRRRR